MHLHHERLPDLPPRPAALLRAPARHQVAFAVALYWGSSHLASSTRMEKGDPAVVGSGVTYADDMASSSAGSPGSPARRKVEMDGGGDGMEEALRAGGVAGYGVAYRGVLAAGKVVPVMDLFNHKPM